MILKAASTIRKEVKDLKDELPWPTQPTDLEPENFNITRYLNEFLTNLFGRKMSMDGWCQ